MRPPTYPVTLALLEVLRAIDIGGGDGYTLMPVGWGEAPDEPVPYLVVVRISGDEAQGPLNDGDADAPDAYQIIAVGSTAQMSERALDLARAALDRADLQAALDDITEASYDRYPDRYIMRIITEIAGLQVREDRGLPEPIFQTLDQIVVVHTPR